MMKSIKKLLGIVLSLSFCCGYLTFSVTALKNETDYKSVEVFADELASLITSADAFSVNDDKISEATIDDECSNRIIVKSFQEIDKLDSVGYISGYKGLHILQFDNNKSFEQAIDYYNSLKDVEYAEEDKILSEAVIDDGIIMESAADFPTEVPSNMFGYTTAKNNSTGGNNVTIAVVDSGVQSDHEFLQGRVEPTGFNSITSGGTCYDDRGHGTQVAGVIVSNTLDNVKIKPYKVLDNTGEGTVSQVVLGIDAAIEDNVDIINLSMSMVGENNTLKEACDRAYNAGIAVIVAAGNKGYDMAINNISPGNFENVISVVSCSNTRYVSSFSNYGGNADCAAPGQNIISSYLNNTYKISSGTSMAAPFICAAVSYLLSKNPDLTPDELQTGILENFQWCLGDIAAKCVFPSNVVETSNATDKPVFKYPDCTFAGSALVEFEETPNTQIYYTFDGTNYYFYDEPFEITETTTVTAFAIESGKYQSTTTKSTYKKADTASNEFVVDNEGNLTAYNGTSLNVTVPSFVNGNPVVSIRAGAFSSVNIESVTFTNTLKTIETNAFKNHSTLQSFYAPNLQFVGDYAFSGCAMLTTFNAPQLTDLGEGSFENTSSLSYFTSGVLTLIKPKTFKNSTVPFVQLDEVTSIGDEAFYNCDNITYVSSDFAEIIGVSAFENCDNLTSIVFNNATNISDRCFCDCIKLNSLTLPNTIEIGASTFENCTSLLKVDIPQLQCVGDRSFYGCIGLSTLTLPLLESAGAYAFCQLPITSVELTNLAEIEEGAFAQCTKLKTVKVKESPFKVNAFEGSTAITTITLTEATELELGSIPICDLLPNLTSFNAEKLLTIPDWAFAECQSLKSINTPAVTSVGAYAYYQLPITYIDFTYLTDVGDYAFAQCSNLKSVNVNDLSPFKSNTFDGSKITSVTLKNATEFKLNDNLLCSIFPNVESFSAAKVVSLPENAFYGCQSLARVNLPSVKTIGDYAFAHTAITELNLSLLETISPYSFADMPALQTFNAPKLTKMYSTAFVGSNNLTTLTINGVTEVIGFDDDNFSFSDYFTTLNTFSANSLKTVPAGMFENASALKTVNLKAATSIGENAFRSSSIQVLDISAVDSLSSGLFSECSDLREVYASSAETMAEGVFSNCTNLSIVDLSSLYKITGEAAFSNCNYLNKFTANKITEIPTATFEGCTKLSSVTIPNVTKIGDRAFKNTNIKSVGSSRVTYIGDYAFQNTSINTINLQSLTYLGEGAFSGCKVLTSVSMVNLDSIPDNAFYNCSVLTTGKFGALSYVGVSAFEGTVLKNFTFTGDNVELGERAFYNCKNLSIDGSRIKRLGSNSVYNTQIFTSGEKLPNLEYIEPDGFAGTNMSYVILENAIDVYDLPDNAEYAMIGSDCVNFDIGDETSLVYSPAGTGASNWCIENNYTGYREYNAENIMMLNNSGAIKNLNDKIEVEVRGFNTTYKLYGVNRDDLSNPQYIKTSTSSGSFSLPTEHVEDMFDYYFVVAEDIENGNTLVSTGEHCENTFTYVKPKNDLTSIWIDSVNNTDHIIYSLASSFAEAIESLYINNEHVEIIPTYQSGDISLFGSGSVFTVYYDGELLREIPFALYGDANGDGVMDVLDCQIINKYATGKADVYEEAQYMWYAADANSDGIIDVNDYQTAVNNMCS